MLHMLHARRHGGCIEVKNRFVHPTNLRILLLPLLADLHVNYSRWS